MASWDSFTPARPYQSFWVALGVLSGLPGLFATSLRILAPTDDVPALFASFIPFGVLAYLVSSLCFLIAWVRARRRQALGLLTTATVALTALHLAWLAPLFVSDQRAAATPTFTLLSLNTLYGVADPEQVAAQAQPADVVVLLESTESGAAALRPYGWDQRFPYVVGRAVGNLGNTVIYSRFPLSDAATLPDSKFQQWVATVDVPDLGPVRLIAAHPCNPFCGSSSFRREHQQLRAMARANLDVPLVVAGDLNAVDDHAPIRALRSDGVRSVTDIVGAGWLPTYPANRTIPPLIAIDHVLVNQFLTATSVETFQVDNTDHLGLVTRIARAR